VLVKDDRARAGRALIKRHNVFSCHIFVSSLDVLKKAETKPESCVFQHNTGNYILQNYNAFVNMHQQKRKDYFCILRLTRRHLSCIIKKKQGCFERNLK
jgi:hypothetical protein